ncbi:MAG TPA: permease prefix domain 1-containing protein [Vicinamibacterales bacterium]|nr:permease prefix domain 1-containing protein [Vicinamibacterales bacterium]
MTNLTDQPLEEQITQWREYLRRRQAVHGPDVEELEGHLRDQLAALTESGLTGDEAFLVAVKRMGSLDALSREFARAHSERLWKQLVIASDKSDEPADTKRNEIIVVVALAIAAGVAVKVPELFGLRLSPNEEVPPFYFRNASLFVFPLLAIYFMWKRGWNAVGALWIMLPFALGAVFANVYPWRTVVVDTGRKGSDTQILSILHLPIALWLAVGFAYVRGRWFDDGGRMNFVRFSGELAIYYVLIALGGGVFTGFTAMMFTSIGMSPEWFIGPWLIPCGAAGAVIIGSWLVEAKQSVIENMAPVLTRLFTPLFTLLLLAFLATLVWTGNPINVERELLIGFDLLLAVVVGLVLYAASARDPQAPPDFFDGLQLLLVASALAVDAVALWAIAARISEFGFTPNRVAALGENIILLVNLAWTAWLYARFVRNRGSFAALERWQIAYLPVYATWAALVVIVFPPLFGFR